MVAKGVMAASFGAGLGEAEVGGIGLALEEHAGRAEDLDGVGMGLGIPEEAGHSIEGG
jgi:hypothetical protein